MSKINPQIDNKSEQIQFTNPAVLGVRAEAEGTDLPDEFSQILDKIAEHLASGRQSVDTIDLFAVEQMSERVQAQTKVQSEVRLNEGAADVEPSTEFESPQEDEGYVPAELVAAQTKAEAEGSQSESLSAERPGDGSEALSGDGASSDVEGAPLKEGATTTPSDGALVPNRDSLEAAVTESVDDQVPVAPSTEVAPPSGAAPRTNAPSGAKTAGIRTEQNDGAQPAEVTRTEPIVDAALEPVRVEASSRIAPPPSEIDANSAVAKAMPFNAFMLQGGLSPSGLVSREVVAQAILRPGADLVARSGGVEGIGSSKGGAGQGGLSAGNDTGMMRGLSAHVKAEGKPQQAKGLSRIAALRTLEKVERALEEVARSKDGKTISLNLEPVNLGKVKVDVSIRDGNLHARLSADSTDVRQLLREHAHELQSLLRKLGLHVDSVAVSVSSDDARSSDNSRSFENRSSSRGSERDSTFAQSELSHGGASASGAQPTRVVDDHWVA